jgi:Beta galactosidase small chain
MGYSYIFPVENGSRSDCKWVAFRNNENGSGLCIGVDNPDEWFSCSALLHSAAELDAATHSCDLEHREDGKHAIHCSIDHKLMGVGGDTR